MRIGSREFDTKNRTYVMGILNVTPDSFSDGGRFNRMDAAMAHTEQMIQEGMDILDVGGESTRPGYTLLSEEEEIERVVPIIEKVKSEFDIPVSLDTYKGRVAQAGIDAGADLINDIWGLKYDKKIADVISKSGVPCCLMHNRKEPDYGNFLQDVAADLAETIHLAEKAGIAEDKIILDPGVGFGKTYENNLEIINCLEELHMFGYPLLLGTSRKSVIGLTLDLPVTERLEGTLVTTVMAVMKRCAFVRVHDVQANVRAIKMAEAIRDSGNEKQRYY
ncbi:MAG: dihydropteroate synthase [Lachnospiraceae bacterium]|nr:dihydropteroate synthase [Lachnospiraceae bacterium]